jgi:SAM-dependent methyltransferase
VQVAAHRYLSDGGRPSLTADSAEIISVLPQTLGNTLELGYGYGLLAREIRERATRYVGVDLETAQASSLAELAAQGVVADVHLLPFRSRCFDTVIADNVLEHAARPLEALCEIRRVLRPDGVVFILIPLDGLAPDFQIRTHLWKADELSLREAVRLAGLDVDLFRVLHYAELGVYGCFPASDGKTGLLRVHPATGTTERVRHHRYV